jgi:hypothetical protein
LVFGGYIPTAPWKRIWWKNIQTHGTKREEIEEE